MHKVMFGKFNLIVTCAERFVYPELRTYTNPIQGNNVFAHLKPQNEMLCKICPL